VAASLKGLAEIHIAHGNYDEAAVLLERSQNIVDGLTNANPVQVAANLNDLGLAYKAQGNYAKAVELLQRSLALEETFRGPREPHLTLATESKIAVTVNTLV